MIVYIVIAVIVVVAAIFLYRKKKRDKEMAQGLQIFNASGQLIFDLSNATTYVLGTGETGTENGSQQTPPQYFCGICFDSFIFSIA